jgi:hypothetical protein
MPEVILKLTGSREAWDPGETIEGNAHLRSPHDWTADYVEVVLWWVTSGKGEQDKGVMHREILVQKGQRIAADVALPFRFPLPKAPWTYHGRLIKIDWYVGLYAREQGAGEEAVITPIRVFPGGRMEPVSPRVASIPDAAPPEE